MRASDISEAQYASQGQYNMVVNGKRRHTPLDKFTAEHYIEKFFENQEALHGEVTIINKTLEGNSVEYHFTTPSHDEVQIMRMEGI